MDYRIVVARYNESVDWLLDEKDKCIIYNKGTLLHLQNEILLENVGRESDTYLRYIIDHYDNLPEVIVFTQARIEDHRGSDDVSYLLQLKNDAYSFGKSAPFITHYKSNDGLCCWDPQWNCPRKDNSDYFLHNHYLNHNRIPFSDWFKLHVNPVYPEPIHIYRNGIFALRKEIVLKYPKERYVKLREHVTHHINPAEGHFFERAWYHIFE